MQFFQLSEEKYFDSRRSFEGGGRLGKASLPSGELNCLVYQFLFEVKVQLPIMQKKKSNFAIFLHLGLRVLMVTDIKLLECFIFIRYC